MTQALFGIFSAFGLSASAGLNAYIPLLVVGVTAHYTNLIKLTPPYDALANPWILILLGILLIIEMLADKVWQTTSMMASKPLCGRSQAPLSLRRARGRCMASIRSWRLHADCWSPGLST